MWWKRAVLLAGLLSLAVGMYQVKAVYSFKEGATLVQASVVAVEYRRGPPKPRQTVPVHVRYRRADGEEVLAVTHLPFLQTVADGDTLTLLASKQDPQDVRIPLVSELFAVPLTYMVLGIIGVVIGGYWCLGSTLLRKA